VGSPTTEVQVLNYLPIITSDALITVHALSRGFLISDQQPLPWHATTRSVCATTVTAAMPVVNAKTNMKARKILFMPVYPLQKSRPHWQ
jgi:hypothetical protein